MGCRQLRGRGHRLTHLCHAAERGFCFRPGSRCACWLIRHAGMLRAVRRIALLIGAAKERLGVGTFDRPAAMMLFELVRLHAGCHVFGLEVGDGAAGFDMRHAASSAFKGVKVRQIVEPRRYAGEQHDLSAAWAMRRLRALVAHGHWSFRLPDPAADVFGPRDYGLRLEAKYLFSYAAREHVIECRMVWAAPVSRLHIGACRQSIIIGSTRPQCRVRQLGRRD